MRKTLEETERETGEQLRKSEPVDREIRERAHLYSDEVRTELANMSAAERRMPAILELDPQGREGRKATGFLMTDEQSASPHAHRVITPNYGFWRARRSPVEVRSIEVFFSASTGGGPPPPPVHNAI